MSESRIAELIGDIGDVPYSVEPSTLRRRSRDYFWYSQALAQDLAGKQADVIVTPRHEADVIKVAAACAKRRVPLTPRGAGTGNYGQAVPLAGGVVLDMSEMGDLEWTRPGVMRTRPGARMHVVDDWLRLGGQEQRLHPSTKRSATIGGFVAGGSGGVGSITWGGLRDFGNVNRLRVMTHPLVALPVWAIDLYAWHIPVIYQAALRNQYLHALEHACFLGAGIAMWMALLGPLPKPAWFGNFARLGYIVGVRLIEGILGNIFLWSHTIFYPYYRVFEAHYGIGPLTAVVVWAELGDCRRFSRSLQVVRHTGLDVTVDQSDRHRGSGHLSRQGPETLRWALFEAGMAASHATSPDRAYYQGVKQAHDGKIAAISMARKLARRCYHTLREMDPEVVYSMPA